MQREGQVRIPAGCAMSGIINKSGKRFSGEAIIKSIEVMHYRSNGLGGGFAAYGIYPEYKDYYALHLFYDSASAKSECEDFLGRHFDIINLSKIPIRKIKEITDEPLIWRYFVTPLPTKLADSQLDEREFTAKCVFRVNTRIEGAYVFSSGKNIRPVDFGVDAEHAFGGKFALVKLAGRQFGRQGGNKVPPDQRLVGNFFYFSDRYFGKVDNIKMALQEILALSFGGH
jgi:hypothetical protein